MDKKTKWTLGTLVFFGIVSFFTLSLLVSNIQVMVNTLEQHISRPSYPIFQTMFDKTKIVYDYLKPVVTSRYGMAALIAISLIVLAMEVEWKKQEEKK